MFEKEPYYNERIEAYLRDELSATEKVDFEHSLQQDPLLYNEFQLQKDIISSIQAHRKAQLKQRLQQIDVSGLSNSGAGLAGSAGWFLAGALVLSITGWLLLGNWGNKSVATKQTGHATVVQPMKASPIIGRSSSATEEVAASASPAAQKTAVAPIAATHTNVPAKSKGNTSKKSTGSQTVAAVPQPVHLMAKPVDSEPVHKEEAFVGNKLPVPSSNPGQRLNVTDNTSSRLKQHYFYQNGQITLLGFEQPYTLLEIQSENITYLYYEGNFYRLDSAHHNPTPIKDFKVTDQALVESLKQSLTSRE